MIGGSVGLGVGAPLVVSTTVVQSGALDANGTALLGLAGQSTVAASSVIAGSAPTSLTGGSIAHVAFGLSGTGTLFAEGRTRAHVAFNVSATSGFDFRNVPLLAGQGAVHGLAASAFSSGFSVPPIKGAIPAIDAGRGQASFAAGTGRASATAGKGCETINGG